MPSKLLASITIVFGCGCVGPLSEDFESHYARFAAARADGAFDRGCLPEIVPESATDLWEFHNIDTNWTWACFTTPDGPAAVRPRLADALPSLPAEEISEETETPNAKRSPCC